jgi:hypothetical protein
MTNSETTTSAPQEFALILGVRQIASVGVLLVLAVGTISGFSYVAGRTVSAKAPAPVVAKALTPSPAPAASNQPTKATSPAPTKAAADCPPPPPAAARTPLATIRTEVVPGALYYQLLSVERGIAEVFVEGLAVRGFSGVVAAGATPTVARVVVGPVEPGDPQHIREKLAALGFTPFGRKF